MKSRYSNNFKIKVLNLFKQGITSSNIIEQYGIPKSTFYDWIRYINNKQVAKDVQKDLIEYKKLIKDFETIKLELNIIKDCHCFATDAREIKLAAIESNYGKYPIKTMCRILDVAPGTFNNYHFRQTSKTQYQIRDDFLKPQILEIFKLSQNRFGARKINAKLKLRGITVSDEKISALMKDLKIEVNLKNKKSLPERKENNNPFLVNRVKKSFIKNHPNDTWVGDITSIKVQGNTYYLCVIIDLFSRKIIGYRVHYNAKNSLVINVLKDAFESRDEPSNLIFHSDRGSQYTSFEYLQLLKSLKIKASFSDTGNPYDNAVVESFFSHLKKEETHRTSYNDFDELKSAISKYVEFYNDYRPHETLKDLSPNEFEQNYYDKKKKSYPEIPD